MIVRRRGRFLPQTVKLGLTVLLAIVGLVCSLHAQRSKPVVEQRRGSCAGDRGYGNSWDMPAAPESPHNYSRKTLAHPLLAEINWSNALD